MNDRALWRKHRIPYDLERIGRGDYHVQPYIEYFGYKRIPNFRDLKKYYEKACYDCEYRAYACGDHFCKHENKNKNMVDLHYDGLIYYPDECPLKNLGG